MTNWKYVDESDGGASYYHSRKGKYQIEVHSVHDYIEVGIYSNKGSILLPPYKIDIPFTDFTKRFDSVNLIIDQLISSL
jgi:hypothetical protein